MEPIRNPHFMQTIVAENLGDGNLEIPRSFVQLHGKDLPPYACLQVPTGTMWRVEIKKDNGRVWLDKGWQTFVEDCAVKCGYSLMFRYEKGSFFQVIVCKTDHSEIIYPNQRIIRDQPRVAYINEEAGDDDSFVDIPPQTMETSVVNQSNGDGEVNQGRGVASSSAVDGVLQRVRNFQSSNPHFTVIVTPSCQSDLCIPSPARIFFHDREDKDVCVNGPDGKSWHMKFCIEGSPSSQVVINSGWIEFAQNYRLQDGDACIFELINSTVMTFNVTTFQIGGGGGREADMNDHEGLQRPIFASAQSSQALKNLRNAKPSWKRRRKRISGNSAPAAPAAPAAAAASAAATAPAASAKKAKKAKSSECSKTSFTVLHKPGRNSLYKLFVPVAHSSSYLLDQHYKHVFLHGPNGKTLRLECYARGKTVLFQDGWRDFVEDNDLQVGDTCAFELLSQGPHHYNVTISRATSKLTEECIAQVGL